MPMMISLIDRRLANTSGHCIFVKADEAIWIPPGLERDAYACGMVQTKDQPAPEKEEAPVEIDDNSAEEDLFAVQLDQALLRLLTRNDESDFTADGNPKTASVVSEMDPECRRPTSTEISEAYQKLQDNIDLAD